MCLESTQMLATACIRHGVESNQLPQTLAGTPYKATHANHPSTIWCGNTQSNYEWVCWHALALAFEYEDRYKKKHACFEQIKQACSVINRIPEGGLTSFARAINKELYPQLNDRELFPNTVLAYRVFYNLDKENFAKWGEGRKPPIWWNPDATITKEELEMMNNE